MSALIATAVALPAGVLIGMSIANRNWRRAHRRKAALERTRISIARMHAHT